MERHLSLPPWSLRQKIALTCRVLAAEGHESALAGQISRSLIGRHKDACQFMRVCGTSFAVGADDRSDRERGRSAERTLTRWPAGPITSPA
jgi:hypothetical protein